MASLVDGLMEVVGVPLLKAFVADPAKAATIPSQKNWAVSRTFIPHSVRVVNELDVVPPLASAPRAGKKQTLDLHCHTTELGRMLPSPGMRVTYNSLDWLCFSVNTHDPASGLATIRIERNITETFGTDGSI